MRSSRIQVADLWDAFSEVYAADTASDPGRWDPGVPEGFHCVPTMLVTHDLFPDSIPTRVIALDSPPQSHYFAYLDGRILDPTGSQFAPDTKYEDERTTYKGLAVRNYVLQHSDTARRYGLFRDRVLELLDMPHHRPRTHD